MAVLITRVLLLYAIFACLTPERASSEDADIERRLDILEKLLIFETNSIREKTSALEKKMAIILTKLDELLTKSASRKMDDSHEDVSQMINTINRRVDSMVTGAQREKVLNQRQRLDIEIFKKEVQGDLELLLGGQKRLDNSIENITDQVQIIKHSTDAMESSSRFRDISIRNVMDQVRMIRDSMDVMESSSKIRDISVRNITDENNMIMNTVKNVLTDQQVQGISIENLRSQIQLIEESKDFIESCSEHKKRGCARNGIYLIRGTCTAIEVYCDMEQDGGGWTVFQRRIDGSEDFYRTWDDYKRGFGKLDGEFWFGNDNLNLLTSGSPQELRIDMEGRDGNLYFAKYSNFMIRSESENYTLSVSGFSGNVSRDSLKLVHNGKQFSTRDRDNDESLKSSCSRLYTGAWWYNSCYDSNLNGLYNNTSSGKGIRWWGKDYKSVLFLRKTEMKFRNSVL